MFSVWRLPRVIRLYSSENGDDKEEEYSGGFWSHQTLTATLSSLEAFCVLTCGIAQHGLATWTHLVECLNTFQVCFFSSRYVSVHIYPSLVLELLLGCLSEA